MIKKILLFVLPFAFMLQTVAIATDAPTTKKTTPTVKQEKIVVQDKNSTPQPISYKAAFTKMIFLLIGIIALAIFTLYMFKKISRSRFFHHDDKAMKILEKKPLSQKSMLYLMEIEGSKVLIMESQIQLRAKLLPEGQDSNLK
jgi:flagellar biogenesis protein FliO